MGLRFIRVFSLLLIVAQCITLGLSIASIPDWDHMVFAQQWPESVCIDANITHQHKCSIAKNITDWTVHGLWPTRTTTQGPNFCNGSDFDFEALQGILPQLLEYWPNVYSDTPLSDFWKHEWTKHGTCAASLPLLNSEVKYFQKGLDLRSNINLYKVLATSGINPRDDYPYQYVEVMKAFEKVLGVTPLIQCSWDKKTKTQYLTQVELCVSKKFEVMACPHKYNNVRTNRVLRSTRTLTTTSPCRDNETIAYVKIRPQ